jgi:hypothetical protein
VAVEQVSVRLLHWSSRAAGVEEEEIQENAETGHVATDLAVAIACLPSIQDHSSGLPVRRVHFYPGLKFNLVNPVNACNTPLEAVLERVFDVVSILALIDRP